MFHAKCSACLKIQREGIKVHTVLNILNVMIINILNYCNRPGSRHGIPLWPTTHSFINRSFRRTFRTKVYSHIQLEHCSMYVPIIKLTDCL